MLMRKLAGVLGLLSAKDGLGVANTALAYHAGRLLALHEGDLPCERRPACAEQARQRCPASSSLGVLAPVRQLEASRDAAASYSCAADPPCPPLPADALRIACSGVVETVARVTFE